MLCAVTRAHKRDGTAALQDVNTLVSDPAWLPALYDPRADTFVFAHLPKETQRRLVFLDRRFFDDIEQSGEVRLKDLPVDKIKAAARPVHFIFHTAFCCSTLLARAMDVPGVAMGLKEPSVLVPLSDPGLPRRPAGAPDPLDVALDLLSRPLEPGEVQIIKPSNAANGLAPHILERRPQSKAIMLYSNLDAYLRSTARIGATGRLFNRQMFAQLSAVMPLRQRFTMQQLLLQTDLQIAAQVWLMQAGFLDAVAKHFGPDRVRTLNSKTLLADKAGVLTRLGDFFGLRAGASQWSEIAAGSVFDRHAKRGSEEPYDPEANKRADDVHAAEVAAVLPKAEALARHCGTPLDLGDTLMA